MTDPELLYAPLCLIRSALCPLTFRAKTIGQLPDFQNMVNEVSAFGELEVGDCLRHESLFPYTDHNKHRQYGCQLVTAPLGLSPDDVEFLFGVCTYLYSLDREEGIAADRKVTLTVNVLAQLAGTPVTCSGDTRRLQSRIVRLSYVKLTNTAIWNSPRRRFEGIENCSLFDINDLGLLTEPRSPFTVELSPKFVSLLRASPKVAFDLHQLRGLGRAARRRLFFIVSREAWNQRDSMIYDADLFAIHQLGFAKHPDEKVDRNRRRRRLHDLAKLLTEFEQHGFVQPCRGWGEYLQTPNHGPFRGTLCLRWSRGPSVARKSKNLTSPQLKIENDALYDQITTLKDGEGGVLAAGAYRTMLKDFGRARIERHLRIVQAQKRLMPGSFQKSEVAAFINRVQHDHPFPSWYTPELNKPKINFQAVQPSEAAAQLYQSLTTKA